MKDYSVLLPCGESTMIVIHDAFDKGYQQGYEDGKKASCDCNKDNMKDEYNRGLNEAWETAKKIMRMDIFEKDAIFAEIGKSTRSIIMDMSASEAIAKIKEYEEQQKQDKDAEIKVGDELLSKYNANKVVVLRYNPKYDGKDVVVLYADGSSGKINKENYEKTGKNIPQIAEVLHQMIER